MKLKYDKGRRTIVGEPGSAEEKWIKAAAELRETKGRLRDTEERVAQLNGYIKELEDDLNDARAATPPRT